MDMENIPDRSMPHNIEAERAVIGALMINSSAMTVVVNILKPSDFYFENNREIYKAALELFDEGSPIDIVTLSHLLSMNDKLNAVGGTEYLTALASSISTTQNITNYCEIIRDKSIQRRLITGLDVITNLAYSGSEKNEYLLERAEQVIYDIAAGRDKSDIEPVSEILMTSYREMADRSLAKGKLTGLATGFRELDRRTAGLQNSDLIIIAGRPGMGKSSFAVNIAEHVAVNDGITVAIFNLEMSKTQLMSRILCSQALVELNKLKLGDLNGEDWMQISEVMERVAAAPLYIDDTPSVTVSEIRAKCRRLKQSKNLGLVVVDYLQLMTSSGRNDNRQQEISEISRSLKILAKELDVPVITLSQLSRAGESRSDKRPLLSDLRESGAIEQDADIVMFLYRDEYYNKNSEEKNTAECIIAKFRSGETGTIKLGWQGKYTKFIDIDWKAEQANEQH
ncbi:MAG: replicative DNA helicase [Oscillospiraceae bacterium]|nr:replicative DNA helicase [Oscillospiraceae bacterium]